MKNYFINDGLIFIDGFKSCKKMNIAWDGVNIKSLSNYGLFGTILFN